MKGWAQVRALHFHAISFRIGRGRANRSGFISHSLPESCRQAWWLRIAKHPALILPLWGIAMLCTGCAISPNTAVVAKSSTTSTAQGASIALGTSASSLNFGSVTVGAPSTQTLTLTSSGTAAVTIQSAAVNGSGFSVTGPGFPLTLAAGQSTALKVQFDPAAAGAVTGTLTLATNATSSTATTVALAGTGQAVEAAKTYSVDLTWQQPSTTSPPITGYYIYRAASTGASYQLLNASLDTSQSYTDSGVESGATYTYYVTSVDSSGLQSTPSNLLKLTIP